MSPSDIPAMTSLQSVKSSGLDRMRHFALYSIEYNDWKWLSMDIEPRSLTGCEVAPDGRTVVLGFTDANGEPAQIRVSLDQAGALAMTLPNLITQALRSRYQDHTLRYAYPLASWTVEQPTDQKGRMVTLRTTDGFSVCFSLHPRIQHELSEALTADIDPRRIVPN